jgi:hypothetical protein
MLNIIENDIKNIIKSVNLGYFKKVHLPRHTACICGKYNAGIEALLFLVYLIA